MEPTKNINKKMLMIMKDVDFIEKDKRNEFHKYNYASEEAIKKALHKSLTVNGVLFSLSVLEAIQIGTITTIKTAYCFTDADSGEKIEGVFMAQGEDKLDKGIYKAITGTIKYILTSNFLIPTGDDQESEPQEQVKQVPAKQTEPCQNCGAFLPEKVYDFSMSKFKKPLCYNCQQEIKDSTVSKKTAKLEKIATDARTKFNAMTPEQQKIQADKDFNDLYN